MINSKEITTHLHHYIQNAYVSKYNDNKVWFNSGTDNAVLTERGDNIEIDFKGTDPTWREWCFNGLGFRRQWGTWGFVHRGFGMFVHGLVGDQFNEDSMISRCLKSTGLIILRGHSRGGPLAILTATVLISHGVDPNRIRVFVYGCPPVGDNDFKRLYRQVMGENTVTVNGRFDIFSKLPWWEHLHGHIVWIDTPWIKFNNHSRLSYIKALSSDVLK